MKTISNSLNYKRKSTFKWSWSQFFLHLVMIILLGCTLYPLAMSLWCAFKTNEVFKFTKFYPTLPIYFGNFGTAFSKVGDYMYNTVAVAILGILGSLIISSLAAYAFARMKFPGKRIFFILVLCLMMIPGVMTLIPSFLMYLNLGLTNKLFSILLPYLTSGPVGQVFLLTIFFKSLPNELFEAAKIDGSSEIKIFFKIAIPLSMPILITQAINQLNGIWNDFLWPSTVITTDTSLYTISAGLRFEFASATGGSASSPVSYASYLLASLPLIAVFVFGNRYYVQGLLNGGIKM